MEFVTCGRNVGGRQVDSTVVGLLLLWGKDVFKIDCS